MTLGLVVTNPSNPFYAQLISGVEVRGRARGYRLLLMVTGENTATERRATAALLESAVDGAIAVPVQEDTRHWKRVLTAGMPVVFANRDLPELGCDFVGIDNTHGAAEATRCAIATGARSVWLVEEDLPVTTIADRITGFRRAMAEAGLPVTPENVIKVPGRRHDAAVQMARDLVRRPGRPDAVVAGDDYVALGFFRALAEQGLRVPEDMAIIGYGDHPYAAYLSPSLTSVHLPAQEVAAAAVDLLLARMRAPGLGKPRKLLITPELVARSSTSTSLGGMERDHAPG